MQPEPAAVTLTHAARSFEQFQWIDAINWLLGVVVAVFMFQVLLEILFRDRGKFCRSCGLSDLPKNFVDCDQCGVPLEEYVEKVTWRERALAYWFPVFGLLVAVGAIVATHEQSRASQLVVLAYVAVCSAFSRLWLRGRDGRLRALFNVPFWSLVSLFALVVWIDFLGRTSVFSGGGHALVTDLEIEADGTPCIALARGGLFRGIGPSSSPYFRGFAAKKLLRNGLDDTLVYIDSTRVPAPDAIVGLHGLEWHPSQARVAPGLELLLDTVKLSPEQRSALNRAAYQQGVSFCWAGDRLWFTDGSSLVRIQADGRSDMFSPGKRELGRFLKVSPDGSAVWLVSTLGLTRVKVGTDRKDFYALADFARRDDEKATHFVAGAVKNKVAWLATKSGDVFKFDLNLEKLTFEGRAEFPRYLDFYSLYTLPFLLVGLIWTLKGNFESPSR